MDSRGLELHQHRPQSFGRCSISQQQGNGPMVDITLSSDRIRTAPIEVRRWIENELAESLGMHSPAPAIAAVHHEQLVACSAEEVGRIFDFVQGMQPVVNVLLELGRGIGSRLPNDVMVAALHEVAARAHLRSPQQVIACVRILNEALQQLRSDGDALLCAVDDEERCYVALETQAHIQEVWQAIVAAHTQTLAKPIRTSAAPPYAVAPASGPALDPTGEAVPAS